jgi:transcriptional regulator with XRE-family HTH domain
MAGLDPTIARRRLRIALREARDAGGRTHQETARAMDFSISKIIRIESGQVGVSTNDLRALLAFYEVPEQTVAELMAAAQVARRASRWDPYKDLVSQDHLTYLGYESSASVILNFEPTVIPGLLQTPEYAREVIAHGRQGNPDVDRFVELRLLRQEVLTSAEVHHVWFVLDESVICRSVGGDAVMERQLRHLQAVADLPHVDIRIAPFRLGLYPYWREAYVLFEFPDPAMDGELFVEEPRGARFVREGRDEAAATVASYRGAFLGILSDTADQDVSALLDDALARLRSARGA